MDRATTRKIFTALTAASLCAALLSLLPTRVWALELLASFRVQITLISLLTGLISLALQKRIWATAAMALTAVQIGMLIPIFVTAGFEPTAARVHLTVLTLNLDWSNRNADEVLKAIREIDPDIVAVEEVDRWWRERLGTLDDILPNQSFDPYSYRPGVAVLSRLPVKAEVWTPLHGRAFASIEFEKEGHAFHFVALHTLPPRSPLLYRARNRQLDDVGRFVSELTSPAIVAGDFNTTPWSPVMCDFQDLTGLVNVRSGRGTFPTWPAWNPLLRVPIDHIFLSPNMGVENVKRVPIPGSDHIGLVSGLTIG